MALRVRLRDVVDAIDVPNSEWRSYLNRETGAMVTVGEMMAMGPDGDLDPTDIEDAEEFLLLPTSFEIDEWSMMRQFAEDRPEREADQLLHAISGRGAFRMFRSTIKRLRVEQEWDRFREARFAAIAREWLEEHGIEHE